MTDAQMIYQVRIGYDAFYSASAPGFTDTEISSVLNKAQDQFILGAVNTKNLTPIKALIDSVLVTASQGNSLLTTNDNTRCYYNTTAFTASNMWKVLSAECNVGREAYSSTTGMFPEIGVNQTSWTKCFISENAETVTNFIDSFDNATSIFINPVFYHIKSGFEIYTDKLSKLTTLNNTRVVYIKTRTDISTGSSTNCQVDAMYHRAIVDLAIDTLKEYVGYVNKNNQQQQ